MHTDSPLVFRRVPRIVALLALAAIVFVGLVLLVSAATLWIGTDLPRLDRPDLAPFRWFPPGSGARLA
jgi:hypothetical protein